VSTDDICIFIVTWMGVLLHSAGYFRLLFSDNKPPIRNCSRPCDLDLWPFGPI